MFSRVTRPRLISSPSTSIHDELSMKRSTEIRSTQIQNDSAINRTTTCRTNNSGVNANLSSINPIEKTSINFSNNSSKKIMVAPQPKYSQNEDQVVSKCMKESNRNCVQRRHSGGAILSSTNVNSSHSGENWCFQENSLNFVDSRNNRDQVKINDVRVAVLEQRVRELEAAIISGHSPSVSTSTSFVVPVVGSKNSRVIRSPSGQCVISEISPTSVQHYVMQELKEKEQETERLRSQLKKLYSKMELRRAQYDDEVSGFRAESQEARLHLAKVKLRLDELENEYRIYREKTIETDAARNSAISSSIEKIAMQEKELNALRAELEKSLVTAKQLEKTKKDLELCELQNEMLSAQVDSKNSLIQNLEDSIFAMKMEASCIFESSSATPQDINLSDVKHCEPISTSAGISESSSNYKLSSEIVQDLPSNLSLLIRKQLNTTMECRLLAKCLKDMTSKAISGDLPSLNRLLGCKGDSMSECECDLLNVDANPISLISAERFIGRITDDLSRVEKDLNDLREKFVEYYEKKVANELEDDESCRVQ
ncbi:unnamed protein product [Dracunculus medinensis]|uniref:Uncharacterized protein n=1 Tax=Dracunculus medinensis TaxID=318479 RepID=A0A0N4U4T8_DRAME|nr:unnamed protein product [Dracunculus medinensis]